MIALWRARGALKHAVEIWRSEGDSQGHEREPVRRDRCLQPHAAGTEGGGDCDGVTLEFRLSGIPGGVGDGLGLASLLALPREVARLSTFGAAGRVRAATTTSL